MCLDITAGLDAPAAPGALAALVSRPTQLADIPAQARAGEEAMGDARLGGLEGVEGPLELRGARLLLLLLLGGGRTLR